MCGILGLVGFDGLRTEQAVLELALSRLAQRGPDDSGEWRDNQTWFGHKRLAIVDTSQAGHQPMQSADGRYVIVFNGAIYNHMELRAQMGEGMSWRGHCDTETLLAAFQTWGVGCLSRLNGMFAFAVWDRVEQKLILARDRMGIKPLYYGRHLNQIVFASRPTAAMTLLSPDERQYDTQALRSYLECGFIPAPYSMYKRLQKLLPGHYAVMDRNGSRLVRYWDFRHIAPDKRSRSEPELLDELESLLDDALRVRLMSDVPLGLYMSSGTDSSLIASSMCRVSPVRPKAFTISFSDPRYDEGPLTKQIAAHLGIDLVTEKLSADDLLKALPTYLRAVDEPLADSAGIATAVLSGIARQHVTVALTGDGGDELFAGYPHHLRYKRLMPMFSYPNWMRKVAATVLGQLPSHNGRLLSGALSMKNEVTLFHYLRSMSKDYPQLLTRDAFEQTASSSEQFEQSAAGMALDLKPVELSTRLDMAFTLPDLYLQKLDMATMAHSIEARGPFMDYRIVEWAMRLPVQYKLPNTDGKYLLKKLLSRRLPPSWVYRRKQGFSVPIGEWLKGPLREWATDNLNDRSLTDQLPIDWDQVRHLYNMQLTGARSSYPLVWAVLMLLSYIKEHDDLGSKPMLLHKAA